MRFKRENWQPTIGDKYDLVKFGELTFVWPKLEEVTTFAELNKLCRPEPVHYEKVMQIVDSVKGPTPTNAYVGIQVSSKYMREHHREFIVEK